MPKNSRLIKNWKPSAVVPMMTDLPGFRPYETTKSELENNEKNMANERRVWNNKERRLTLLCRNWFFGIDPASVVRSLSRRKTENKEIPLSDICFGSFWGWENFDRVELQHWWKKKMGHHHTQTKKESLLQQSPCGLEWQCCLCLSVCCWGGGSSGEFYTQLRDKMGELGTKRVDSETSSRSMSRAQQLTQRV